MTAAEFHNLKTGDIVCHISGGRSYVVTDNFGGRATAVRTVDMTNAAEWERWERVVDPLSIPVASSLRGLVGGMD